MGEVVRLDDYRKKPDELDAAPYICEPFDTEGLTFLNRTPRMALGFEDGTYRKVEGFDGKRMILGEPQRPKNASLRSLSEMFAEEESPAE